MVKRYLFDEMILALVAEDDVDLFRARTADVGTEHDVVRGFAVHVGLVQGAVEHLDVATTTVDVLLVFHGELHNQLLVPDKIILFHLNLTANI